MIKTGNRIFINKHDTCDQFPYQKIVITPKKYENSCEQIEMLKEDYLSLKNNFNQDIDQLLLSFERQRNQDSSIFQSEISRLNKYYQNKISKLESKNNKRNKEQLLEIEKLNKVLNKKCHLISIDDISDFHCPISWEIFKEPVVLEDGFTYEKENISEWLINHKTSPNTNRKIFSKRLIPNQTLKNVINMYQEVVLSLNKHKHQIDELQDIIQVMSSEIESLNRQKDSLLESINELKPKKNCLSNLFFTK